MKKITLLLFALLSISSLSAQEFNNLFNTGQNLGSINFYSTGTSQGYRITEGSIQGGGSLLNFKYINSLSSINIMSFNQGSVIIGNPGYTSDKLSVNGSSSFYGNVVLSSSNNLGDKLNVTMESSFNGEVDFGGKTNFNNNARFNEKAFFNDNVGIGTLNPTEKLSVKGKIVAEEVEVVVNVPADYVFEKYYTGASQLREDYIMPSLNEVEEFIMKNNHLPEIPSAKKIKEDGVQLGVMTNLLLQKIEELTLYTLEQEKRINILEDKLFKK